MSRKQRRGALGRCIAVCLAGASLLTACGSGQGSGGGAGSLTVATSATYALDEIGVPAAKSMGLWKGLSVKLVQAEDLGRTMASGSADIGIGSPTRLVGPMLDGTFKGVLIGPTTNKLLIAWAVNKNLNISNLGQLKGKTFGISSFGSLGDLAVHLLAKQQHWSSSDFKEVALGGSDGLVAGLERGSIDAFAWTPLLPYSLQGDGKAKAITGTIADALAPDASSAIFATPQAIKAHPKDIKKFCEGFYTAQSRLIKNVGQVTNLLVTKGGYKDSPSLRYAVKQFVPDIATSSTISKAMMANILKAAQISSGKLQSATVAALDKHYKSCSSL